MITFGEADYRLAAPSYRDIKESSGVFLAPPALRPLLRRALSEVAARPLAVAAALRHVRWTDLLRFLAWNDTARCWGVQRLAGDDEVQAALEALLPATDPMPSASEPAGGISGLVLAHDEEAVLGRALASLSVLVDDLVVVDDHSTDGTAEIARSFDARVIRRSLDHDFAAQRNAGLAEIRTRWTFMLDADEVLDPDLVPMVRQALAAPGIDAVAVPRLTSVEGVGEATEDYMWPDLPLRAFRSDLRYETPVHEQLTGWRRVVYTPLSGPYIEHHKTGERQQRAVSLYDEVYDKYHVPAWRMRAAIVGDRVKRRVLGSPPSEVVRRPPPS